MPDVFPKAKRSDVMSRIRSRGNADTELALAKLLRAHGITGWRRHQRIRCNVQRPASNVERSKLSVGSGKLLSVRPDFVFPKLKLALFVDGCFWHACPKHGTRPKGNAAFWRRKFAANVARDRRVNRALRRAGWRVVRIWEHTLRWANLQRVNLRRATTKRGGRNGERGSVRLVARLRRALDAAA